MRRSLFALWLLALCLSMSVDVSDASAEPKKNGAGLLFVTPDSHVLLLLRAGKHNAGKWGLPGGNVEDADTDLKATAKREAAEELGGEASLPQYEIAGDGILTKRGRFGSKHYTVFVAKVSDDARVNFSAPNLNALEHSDYKWFKFSELDKMAAAGQLHPVVKKLLSHHRQEVLKAAGAKE